MKPATVTLFASDRSQLSRFALATAPAECCGLLVGHQTEDTIEITAVHATENLSTDKLKGFEIDFRVRLQLEEQLATGPDRIVGLYHSHPNGNPRPSDRDLEEAAEQDFVWLILAVDGIGAGDLSAWWMSRSVNNTKSFSALPITIKR